MEKDSPSKPSVAELAGRFKGHILPMPTSNNEPPFRRRPPCSLKLHNQKENDNEDAEKTLSPSNPVKVRTRNSAFIEKLQANLALSPTALLPSPKSPDVKLAPAPLSPTSPQSPLSPGLRPSQQSSEEEDPVSFETPPEGTTLPSLHKTRARLSFKRRPPTRQHRRSAGDEEPAAVSPCDPAPSPGENGLGEQVFDGPAPGDAAQEPAAAQEGEEEGEGEEDVPERDRDCDTIQEEEAARSSLGDAAADISGQGDLEEEPQPSEPCPAEGEADEEETAEEAAAQDENQGI